MSKTLATLATQPLIVAKVGLQSRPPPARKGRPFRTFSKSCPILSKMRGQWPCSRNRPSNPQGSVGSRLADDDKGKVGHIQDMRSPSLENGPNVATEWRFCSSSCLLMFAGSSRPSCNRLPILLRKRPKEQCQLLQSKASEAFSYILLHVTEVC